MDILWMIIIGNTILATIWLLVRLIRKRDAKYAILFYFIPIFGFILYYVPIWVLMIRKRVGYDRDSLVNRIPVDKTVEQVDLEEAFRLAPIQDVLIEGSDMEKRQLLLNRLKKDMNSSYETIKEAKNDSDSESVHYVSSVRMELYNKNYTELESAREAYRNQNGEDEKRNLLKILSDFIHSDLLQEIEQKMYMEEFCNLFKDSNKKNFVEAYNDYIRFLCDMKYDKDVHLELKKGNVEYWNYETYNQLLNYFYDEKEKNNFYWVMKELKNSKLLLDQRGINLIRFWQEGGSVDVID